MLGHIYLNVLAIVLSGDFLTSFFVSTTENNLEFYAAFQN